MRLFTALFFVAVLPAAAQIPQVPQKMEFAGITLSIRDDARRDIQKDVDVLTASPKYFGIKAERAKIYFPIIEKIFREEGLPEDFKYLVLQESALIPDAISSSNAVGFWQFKDFTAIEMGLRVDREIDERLNIASSTRAAARYIIKNNQFFDNWLYALQSYQMGAGGVMKVVADSQPKATRMEVTSKTYWYVKKFLAHKIAYEGVKGRPQTQIVAFENSTRNTLKRLAQETSVDENVIRNLNKWTKSGIIPDDKTYLVLLPAVGGYNPFMPDSDVGAVIHNNSGKANASIVAGEKSVMGKINGIHTIQAMQGDNAAALAKKGGVDFSHFLEWNDLNLKSTVIAGQFYFLGRKRLRAAENFHKLLPGETLWIISQRYGVQMKRLKRYNRMEVENNPAPGTIIFLASKRPKNDLVTASVESAVEVSQNDTFNWGVQSEPVVETIKIDSVIFQETPENRAQDESVKNGDSVKILQTIVTVESLEDTTPQFSTPLPDSKEHIVKGGETLYGIASLYNLNVMELVTFNKLNLQQGIWPGQVLKLSVTGNREPGQESASAVKTLLNPEVFHVVKTSDTLYSIARQYGVTIQEIMEWNEKKDFSLSVGEKLKIIRGQ